ncbi:hypothetical protein IP90_02145 [Luteimonas cucumeris]|uniref:Uncharacterized protein n=1 Tax=Luteimonas cucumeris TaxID=985012 RepID=A0A562L5U1_9GAMM|nr:hypothetical protein [Luteimonas cucumeris]TWI03042.1 hypothetical protein IP90_02145 [Luteimonas cucumeris]
MIRKLLLTTALIVAAATACQPASARSLVDIDLIDRTTGQWLPEYPYRGRSYVPGEAGHRYTVRLTNTSGERVLVVLSVDGVNAVDGRTAHPSQAGYVLAPWQSTEISGWRKSMDEVAQFYFTELPDSYAARTGRPDNVGVVGIAVFREARPRHYDPPYPRAYPQARDEAADASGAPAAKSSRAMAAETEAASSMRRESAPQRIGTGHGAREWSPVAGTDFVRASSRPAQVTQLRYDDPVALATMGILPRPLPYWGRDEPRAFPGAFVADPPGG